MILSVVVLYLAGAMVGSKKVVEPSGKKTTCGANAAVLLGGLYDSGATETYSCDLVVEDVGKLEGLEAAVLMEQLVYCGGEHTNGVVSHICFVNELGRWVEIESMNVARSRFTLTALGDKLLAVGGKNKDGFLSSMEIFDGSSWKLLPFNLTQRRYDHCAIPISESKVLVIGGEVEGNIDLSTVEIYDINEGFMEQLPPMPTARYTHDCAFYNGEAYVAGGYNGQRLNVVEIYNPWLRSWRTGPPMLNARADVTMEVVDDNLVVFGGSDGGHNSLHTMERFDGEAWREELMQYQHSHHASVAISC